MKRVIVAIMCLILFCNCAYAGTKSKKNSDNAADTEFANYIDKYFELYQTMKKVDALQSSATRECCNPSDPERTGCSGVPSWESERCRSVGRSRAMQIYGDTTDGSRKRVERLESIIKELINTEKISASALNRAKRMLNVEEMCYWSDLTISLCEK
jgi:hypothetical protein